MQGFSNYRKFKKTGLLAHEKTRFLFVGIANTTIDFVVLFSLTLFLGFPVIVANIFSTSIALIFSYILNKKAVFSDNEPHSTKQFTLFLVVTLSGLWVVQSIVITTLVWMIYLFSGQQTTAFILLISKGFATLTTMIWNYVLYRKLVFVRRKNEK